MVDRPQRRYDRGTILLVGKDVMASKRGAGIQDLGCDFGRPVRFGRLRSSSSTTYQSQAYVRATHKVDFLGYMRRLISKRGAN